MRVLRVKALFLQRVREVRLWPNNRRYAATWQAVMLNAAFIILAVAVLLGAALAALYLHTDGAALPWPLAALHGLLGVGGLSCLVLVLRGPLGNLDRETGSFGMMSAVLLALAALVGVGILARHLLTGRRAGTLIGIHATLAVSGFVVLAAYLFAG
jgi:hypothetical protein